MIFDVMQALADCLCAQIVTDGSPETCFCGVIPGDIAVADYGGDCSDKCGVAWVRLNNGYPAAGVGIQNTTAGNCNASIGFEVEVGILRCMDVPNDGIPTADELHSSSEQQIKDMQTIWRAVACCPSINAHDYIIANYRPMGPMGGIVGGAWIIQMVL